MIWICIPVHNGIGYTMSCLDSIMKQTYRDFNVIVCDDGSSDNTSLEIKCKYQEQIKILHGDGNLWWSGAMNLCFQYVMHNGKTEDYVLMLNNDLRIKEDYLHNLIKDAKKKTMYGSVAVDINNPEKVVYAGELLNRYTAKPTHFHKNYRKISRLEEWESDTLTGRGTLFPIQLLKEIGFMNNQQMPQYAADNDFAIRAKKAGYKLLIKKNSVVYSHVENTGIGSLYRKNTLRQFLSSFRSIKSPNYYKARISLATTYAPAGWVPFFLVLQLLRIIGAFAKRNYLGVNR